MDGLRRQLQNQKEQISNRNKELKKRSIDQYLLRENDDIRQKLDKTESKLIQKDRLLKASDAKNEQL